jgi:GNAT superfamily N-acetyltransferase
LPVDSTSREQRVALAAYRCLYPAAVEVAGATVLRSDAAPHCPMLNLIVGLGVAHPASEPAVDDALAAIGDDVSCYVSVDPASRPEELPGWLRDRGLVPGWGWMTFRRDVGDIRRPATRLELTRVGRGEASAFGHLVQAGYDLPDAVAPWVAAAHASGWDCWLALDGDVPIGAAGVFLAEGIGYLGLAATLPEHRGKGAQNALLAARISHARAAGCDAVITETGEYRTDRPSNSYRNILRAGFAEVAVKENWLRPARTVT